MLKIAYGSTNYGILKPQQARMQREIGDKHRLFQQAGSHQQTVEGRKGMGRTDRRGRYGKTKKVADEEDGKGSDLEAS